MTRPEPEHSDWIDVSVPLKTGMVNWPGDPTVNLERIMTIEAGDEANVTLMSMCAHTGTHMDAPLHYLDGGLPIDAIPPAATIGPARVIEIADTESIQLAEIESAELREGERVLFKTHNSTRDGRWDHFLRDAVYIAPDAARFLGEVGIRTVGIDYLSVGSLGADSAEIHRVLLSAGIWVIEGLDLEGVEPGNYEMLCLPLRIVGGDGAPARCLLRAI